MRLATALCLMLIAATAFADAPADAPATAPASTRPSAVAGPGIPPSPKAYMNDYAGVVPPAAAARMNRQLQQLDKDTTNQFVVAVYRKMNSPEAIESYTLRVASAWGVGQKGKDNGVVLFVFVDDHELYMQVGSGLADRLTNAAAKQIIETQIVPKFRSGDFGGGIEAGVKAVIDTIQQRQR